jgi:membrane-associated phospholipid phosphatase
MALLLWQKAALAFFVYLLAVLPGRGAGARASRRAVAGSLAGLSVVVFTMAVEQPVLLQDWIWPPLVLLIAYWTSGVLFVSASPGQERALFWLDERLDVLGAARRVPRPVADVLELAYVGVYPLVPLALLLHVSFAPVPDPDHFWAIVLVTDFLCFGVLPWVQTRPPRALEGVDPWRSSIRPLNLGLLGSTSIQANTFPSGHAAEAFVAALVSVDAPAPIAAVMFLAALAVAAGAVLGRYHYLADVLAGWAVALVVWVVLR